MRTRTSVVGVDGSADGPTTAPWLKGSYWAPAIEVVDLEESIRLDVPLPDGTSLTDGVNEHLCDTIRRIVFEVRTGPLAKTDDGAVQYAVARDLVGFVSWMLLNGLYRFSYLGADDIRKFLEARSCGLETCLDVPRRVSGVLERYERRPEQVPPFARLLNEANVDSKSRDYPLTLALVDEFFRRHGVVDRLKLAPRKTPPERITK
ncbi:hypothetical protein, partial [Microvirga massiliensis]|uniref:hypothetical protein n=1 Tax=Microvirga massiliensis TaxID=1033741 RepID=UPI00164DE9CF